MGKIGDRIKAMSTSEKALLLIILVLIIGIIIRWDFISRELSDDFRERFYEPETEQIQQDSTTVK